MAEHVTLIAVGRWEERNSLSFVPVNEKVNGILYNAFGVPVSAAGDPAAVRRPYRMEESGTTTFVMYDSDERVDVPIYKIEEV